MIQKEKYAGQVFFNRKIIRDSCTKDDWISIGKPVPRDISRYRLSECLNCGAIIPVLMKNILERPPKRCCFCSNIRNTSKTIKSSTNTWVVYDTYAVVNVVSHSEIIQAYISVEDYDAASSRTWRASKKKNKYYLVSGSRSQNNVVYMHRFILRDVEIPVGYEVDHIDGNSLNNTRENLRVVSRLENIQNMSERIDSQLGIRGVCPDGHGRFAVDFAYNGRRYYFKPWGTIEEAVCCRKAAEDYFGLEILKRNPKVRYIESLPEYKQQEIYNYVREKIS